jgi:hypothetical protein
METQESTDKFLNLVFNRWEGETEIYNLSDYIGNQDFNNPAGFFDFYERYYFEHLGYPRYSLPIKKCNLSDVYKNPQKEYFYAIKTQFGLKEIFKDRKAKFDQDVLDCFKECKNITFMYIREHESETREDFDALKNFIIENELSELQFLILSNNPNVQNYLNESKSEIRFHKLNLLKITSSSVFREVETKFLENKSGKFFSCFNKNPKRHRYSLLLALDYYKLLDDVNWSLIGKTHSVDRNVFYNFLPESLWEKIDFTKFENIELKESDYEISKGYFNSDLSVNNKDFPKILKGGGASGGLMLPEFINTFVNNYFNIVTESIFEDFTQTIHITEKSVRPFYFYQFPLILATHGHVKYMKENYGFDFYNDIIDHSYDDEPNQSKRIGMIIDEILRINNNKEFFIDFYKNNKERFENNKKIVENLSNDDNDFNFFKSILN